jgi:hypothetical protein
MRLQWYVARIKAARKHKILVEKLLGKRPFERPRRRWEIIVKLILRDYEIMCTVVIWIRVGISEGFCEKSGESWDYLKSRGFIFQFWDWLLVPKRTITTEQPPLLA